MIASFVLYPTIVGAGEFSVNPAGCFCAYKFTSQMAETVFTLIVVFILVVFCLSIVCFSYHHVSKTIREHNAGLFSSLSAVSVQEINLSKVLFVLVFAFALCWLPTFVVIFIARVIIGKAPHELTVVIPFLLQTSSVLNPLIYGALSPPFQREFRRLLNFQGSTQLEEQGEQSVPAVETMLHFEIITVKSQTDICVLERVETTEEPQTQPPQHAMSAWL